MKNIQKILLVFTLLFLHLTATAEILSLPGAHFKTNTGLPAAVSEQNGCFFNVNNTGIELPIDATVISLDIYANNLTVNPVNVGVTLMRHYGNSLPDVMISSTMAVNPGHQTIALATDQTGYIPADNFVSLFVNFADSQVGLCGVKVHYLNDLIYAGSFD